MSEGIGPDLIPRIDFEDFGHDLKESLRPKVERLGYCGEIWQIGANVPQSMFQFCELTEALKSEIDMKYVELVALTAAGVMGNSYEKNQHERLANSLEYGRDWIAQVNELQAERGRHMTDAECILLSVGRCVMHAIFRNTLGLEPPVASLFEEKEGGQAA